MADTFTTVTSTSWGSRLMNSIKSVLFGIILFLISFILLWWNEGNSIRTATGLEEGAKVVAKINADQVLPEFDGKLVHLSGDVKTAEFLDDPMFNIHVMALKLKRSVSMYQWTETSKSTETKKVGGGTETTTTYTYSQEWKEGRINSGDFKQQEGHLNPELPIEQQLSQVSVATLGAFKLNPSQINDISNYTPYPVEHVDPIKVKGATPIAEGVFIGNGTYSSPQVGDVKVSFSVVNPGTVSIVAKQSSDSFEDYVTGTGTTISLLDIGIVPPEKMFDEAQSMNTLYTWLARAGGFFMMFLGLTMIFKPFVVLADVLPFLGNLLGAGVGIFAFAVSFLLSFLTIAIAWIFYRPVLGISLLVIGAGVFVMIYRWSKKKKEAKTASVQTVPA